jgi:hypothetical protein
MRSFMEPTQKNLLRPPLVFGVPASSMFLIILCVVVIQFIGHGTKAANLVSGGMGFTAYIVCRVLARYGRVGWDEAILFGFELLMQRIQRQDGVRRFSERLDPICIVPPDTLDEVDLIREKEALLPKLKSVEPGERLTFLLRKERSGCSLSEVRVEEVGRYPTLGEIGFDFEHVYQLCDLAVATDPVFFFHLLSEIETSVVGIVSFFGLDRARAKKQVESSRLRSAHQGIGISSVDSEVTFGEATRVALELSRGTEFLLQGSLVLCSKAPLRLDAEHFCEEKRPFYKRLAVLSALGLRPRLHRAHIIRAVTATDLIPNIGDGVRSDAPALLETRRGTPLYLDFRDPAFSAFHVNVNGTTGVGKSVFVSALMDRMIQGGAQASVLFVDHLRSYRKLVIARGGQYIEPASLEELKGKGGVMDLLLGCYAGIEFSEMPLSEKRDSLRFLLLELEAFLKHRPTHHLIYLVLDECWSVLREEPFLVQRAFREYRKLDGAAVAITQSLADLIKDENGQAIFQNSPIQVILRQREDPARYTGDLGLNATEIQAARSLRQEKGHFSECLVKTPFYSRIGRLVLTEEEHELYRTDTVRREWVRENIQGVEAHA